MTDVLIGPMCEFADLSKAFIWIFVAGSCCMAVMARKLNEHLLVVPPPPWHTWFRKKIHIKATYLLKPDLYFDQAGQPWAWRMAVVSAFTLFAGLLSFYVIFACR